MHCDSKHLHRLMYDGQKEQLTEDRPSMLPAQHASHLTAARNYPDPQFVTHALQCNCSIPAANSAVCTLHQGQPRHWAKPGCPKHTFLHGALNQHIKHLN